MRCGTGRQIGCRRPRTRHQMCSDTTLHDESDDSTTIRVVGRKRMTIASMFPSRAASRIWGMCHSVPVPSLCREPLYKAWGWMLGCDLEEAERPLHEYGSFQDLFSRKVRPGTHAVERNPNVLVSPVDGRVVSMCEMCPDHGVLEQVKGINYDVSDFLGMRPTAKPGNKIFGIVMYLAPNDYHRYHSPTEWSVTHRSHFAGQLLPVNKVAVNLFPSLFCANERVCCFGAWRHGFFSYTAVGATNVGSMTLDFDDEVSTNKWISRTGCCVKKTYDTPIELARGEQIGKFRLGSTVVLVFEAPAEFVWDVQPGEKIRMGCAIGHLNASSFQFDDVLKANEVDVELMDTTAQNVVGGESGLSESENSDIFDSTDEEADDETLSTSRSNSWRWRPQSRVWRVIDSASNRIGRSLPLTRPIRRIIRMKHEDDAAIAA